MIYQTETRRIERLEIKLTPQEKELFKKYCEENRISCSEFLRNKINEVINK